MSNAVFAYLCDHAHLNTFGQRVCLARRTELAAALHMTVEALQDNVLRLECDGLVQVSGLGEQDRYLLPPKPRAAPPPLGRRAALTLVLGGAS